jgi:hypothetical protein
MVDFGQFAIAQWLLIFRTCGIGVGLDVEVEDVVAEWL